MVKPRLVVGGLLVALAIVFGCNSLWSQTYADKLDCYTINVPPDWQVDASSGTITRFTYNRDALFSVVTDSTLSPVTLAAGLERLKADGFNDYIESVTDTQVDGEPALWLTISSALDFRYVVVVINPHCNAAAVPLYILTNQENPSEVARFLQDIHLTK